MATVLRPKSGVHFVIFVLVVLPSGFSPVTSDDASPDPSILVEMAKNFIQDSAAKGGGNLASILEGLGTAAGGGMGGSGGAAGAGFEPLMAVISAFAAAGSSGGGGNGKGGSIGAQGMELLSSLAPILLRGLEGHEHSDDPNEENDLAHERFEQTTAALAPFFQSAWQAIVSSETVSNLMSKSGLQSMLDNFYGPGTPMMIDRAMASLENPSFRKKWLRSLVSFAAEYVSHITDPEVQRRYILNAALTINPLLREFGWAESELIHLGRPFEESSIRIIDTFMRKMTGSEVDSAQYIKPVVHYVNQLISTGKEGLAKMSKREVEDSLSDVINKELVESVLRVWRAYKYALKHHKCDRYLLCELNRDANSKNYILRPGVTRVASVISSWFMSGHTGTSFWNLYSAATERYDCESKYPVDCAGFHEEDQRATTEYYEHNEL